MIYLIHGDNIEASRNELTRIRRANSGVEYREIDGKSFDESAFVTALESSSLFGGKVLIVIERLFSSIGKKPTLQKKIVARLKSIPDDTSLIFWEDKKCSDAVVKTLVMAKNLEFSFPKILFQYLDAIKPDNGTVLLELLDRLLKTDAPELILFMTSRRIRELIAVKTHAHVTGIAPWQASRLTSQNRAFTMDTLLSMHDYLTQSEYSLKTGSTPFDCSHILKQFIVDELH